MFVGDSCKTYEMHSIRLFFFSFIWGSSVLWSYDKHCMRKQKREKNHPHNDNDIVENENGVTKWYFCRRISSTEFFPYSVFCSAMLSDKAFIFFSELNSGSDKTDNLYFVICHWDVSCFSIWHFAQFPRAEQFIWVNDSKGHCRWRNISCDTNM